MKEITVSEKWIGSNTHLKISVFFGLNGYQHGSVGVLYYLFLIYWLIQADCRWYDVNPGSINPSVSRAGGFPQIVTICNSKVVPPNESAQEFHNQGLTWPCCQIWLVLSKPCYPFSYPFVKRCLVGASSLHGLFLIWKLSYFSQLHGISGIPTYTNCDGDMIGVVNVPFWGILNITFKYLVEVILIISPVFVEWCEPLGHVLSHPCSGDGTVMGILMGPLALRNWKAGEDGSLEIGDAVYCLCWL